MRIFNILITIISFSILVNSCEKEEPYVSTPKSITVPEWVSSSPNGDMKHPSDNPLTEEGIALGRKLFYDKKLSGDNTMSCSTCHLQEFNFSDNNKFSEGITGALGDRQAMAIINLGWDSLFFWDGRSISLEDQALGPVVNPVELNAKWTDVVFKLQTDSEYPDLFLKAFGTKTVDSLLVAKAIAQFERTMISFNSKYDKFFYNQETNALNASEKRGYDLYFDKAECIHCHAGPLLNDPTFRNNGLDANLTDLGLGKISNKSTDNGKFKVPTLRNIAESAPYMHDGRFATLEDVINFYNSDVEASSPNIDPEMEHFEGGLNLTQTEKDDLLAFLKTFSDTQFLENKNFSDPN